MNPQPSTSRPEALAETHQVFNQPPPLQDDNLFETDAALRDGVIREGADRAVLDLARYGEICGRSWHAARPKVIAAYVWAAQVEAWVGAQPAQLRGVRARWAAWLRSRPWYAGARNAVLTARKRFRRLGAGVAPPPFRRPGEG